MWRLSLPIKDTTRIECEEAADSGSLDRRDEHSQTLNADRTRH